MLFLKKTEGLLILGQAFQERLKPNVQKFFAYFFEKQVLASCVAEMRTLIGDWRKPVSFCNYSPETRHCVDGKQA